MKFGYRHMSRKEVVEFLYCPSYGLQWVTSYLDVDRSFQSKLDEESRQEA